MANLGSTKRLQEAVAKVKPAESVVANAEERADTVDRLQAANCILLSVNNLCVEFRSGPNDDSGEDFALAVSSMVIRAGMHLDRVLEAHGASGREWDDEI